MRIRTIKPEFWKSERMCMLPAETQLLAIGLLNFADDEGYFLAHPALIRGELMPFVESHGSIPRMLDELAEIEYIRLGEDEQKRRVGLVVNFKKHQRVDRPQKSKLAGTVEFPNWSPKIPGILAEDSAKAPRRLDDDSANDRGGLAVGMEGNGRGMEREEEGSLRAGKPPGELPLALPGLSMPPVAGAVSEGEREVMDDPAACPEPGKKEGGRGGPEGYEGAALAIWPGQAVPDWGLLAPAGQKRVLAWLAARRSPEQAGRAAPRPDPEQAGSAVTRAAGAGEKKKGGAGPVFPEGLPAGYVGPLTQWWGYKREKRAGYTASGWAVLIERERQFPAAVVAASVQASMANNWEGLFTAKIESGDGAVGAKKGGGRGGFAEPVVAPPAMPENQAEPAGWGAVWAELYTFPAPASWRAVPKSNREDVLRALRGKETR